MNDIVIAEQELTLTEAELDELTRSLTAFQSFEAMLNSAQQYRPTIYPRDFQHVRLANAYDKAQEQRKDARRAYRGSNWPLPEPILSARLTSNCPHRKRSNTCCGDAEWLQVIHAMQRPDPQHPSENWIGAPLYSHHWWAGGWAEEYRDFRVVLDVNDDGLSNYVQARTPEAAEALRAAYLKVTGQELHQ